MKIRIRTNLGSAEYPGMPWLIGEEREVSEAVGDQMVARGVAEAVASPKPQQPVAVEAVPDKPEIAEAKKPRISGVK